MNRLTRTFATLAAIGASVLIAGCERPPIDAIQHGFRGTGLAQIYNPRTVASQQAYNAVPESPAPASPDGPKAGQVYQNVKLLGDLSVAEFARTMVSITAWIAPKEGCTYCHVGANFADDGKYTKVVARRMIEMTRHVNADWKTHVAATGVTCYTCHRGNPVPNNVWTKPAPNPHNAMMMGNDHGQNVAAVTSALSSLPFDPFTPFLLEDKPIRVIGATALPTGNLMSTKQTEWTYSLMNHMSTSLGVNCTYCHNTRSFKSWDDAPPQRVTAWYGIRMARDLNNQYMVPLTSTFPANRLGPTGDVAKVACSTCHQGVYKPLNGVSMLAAHPELAGPGTGAPVVGAAPAAAPAVSAAAPANAVLLFASGSSALPGDAEANLAAIIAGLKSNTAAKAAISGYHSAAGSLATNQELAKKRAFAVRDALTAAGVAADRVVLEKPVQAEANLAGDDPKARRVEVSLR